MNEQDVRVINFAHEENGVFIAGTLSTLDGAPKASWTLTQSDSRTTQHADVDDDVFEALWDALNEPVFRRHAVRDPNTPLDFRRNYVVGVMFDVQGQAGRVTYLIPSDERDPVWRQWLTDIASNRSKG